MAEGGKDVNVGDRFQLFRALTNNIPKESLNLQGWMSEILFLGCTMHLPASVQRKRTCNQVYHWQGNGTKIMNTPQMDDLLGSDVWCTLQPISAEAYRVGKEKDWYANCLPFFGACAKLWGLATV